MIQFNELKRIHYYLNSYHHNGTNETHLNISLFDRKDNVFEEDGYEDERLILKDVWSTDVAQDGYLYISESRDERLGVLTILEDLGTNPNLKKVIRDLKLKYPEEFI